MGARVSSVAQALRSHTSNGLKNAELIGKEVKIMKKELVAMVMALTLVGIFALNSTADARRGRGGRPGGCEDHGTNRCVPGPHK